MTARPAILPERGLADRLTGLFWRHPRLLLAVLLAPPLLWLGVVYLGALAALLSKLLFHRRIFRRGERGIHPENLCRTAARPEP